jgi:hypothetical protein
MRNANANANLDANSQYALCYVHEPRLCWPCGFVGCVCVGHVALLVIFICNIHHTNSPSKAQDSARTRTHTPPPDSNPTLHTSGSGSTGTDTGTGADAYTGA